MVHYEVLENDEEALFYSYDGRIKLIKGPRRVLLFRSRLVRLDRFTAQSDEYLRIENKDGSVEHRNGPCTLFHNIQTQKKIEIKKCYCLDSNQAVVTYKKNTKIDKYEKEVIHGPNMYALKPGEWVHEFSWHGCDDSNKTRFIAGKNKFQVLNCAPDQFYYNVDEVRTSDDALIRRIFSHGVKIELLWISLKIVLANPRIFEFYTVGKNAREYGKVLKQISVDIFIKLKMQETKDPIGDFINCCTSDVITFTASKSYMDFIENCFRLNELDQYPRLVERAKKIGFEITKVVFRGYFASTKLQSMHDNSIKTRTKLKLDHESEVQFQEAEDVNLESEMKRLKSEQELEFQKLIHKNNLEKNSILNSSKIELEKNIKKVHLETDTKLLSLHKKHEDYKLKLEHLSYLKSIGVNLTDYLVASITKALKLVQIVNKSTIDQQQLSNNFANLHFHQ